MWEDLKLRVIECAEYVVETGATVRQTAKVFHLGKSTVHKDLTVRLREIDVVLHERVRKVLRKNLAERHIRGGLATKNKYAKAKSKRGQ